MLDTVPCCVARLQIRLQTLVTSHVHFPCHSELSRGPVTRPLLTQSGRERRSIVDDGFNVLRVAIIFERAVDYRRHTNG
jgi:hypothetical protein